MKSGKVEFSVGLFVIIGALCAAYLVVSLGELRVFRSGRYSVYAYFTSVSGLTEGASVEMAGVEIGNVVSISLDNQRLLAKVEMAVQKDVELSEDVIASVKTSGIIGDKYIDISPGGAPSLVEPGGIIYNTESALDIESLVRKYIFSKQEK